MRRALFMESGGSRTGNEVCTCPCPQAGLMTTRDGNYNVIVFQLLGFYVRPVRRTTCMVYQNGPILFSFLH